MINEELLQALYLYLISRPMREVEGLVNGLRQVKEEQEKAKQVEKIAE